MNLISVDHQTQRSGVGIAVGNRLDGMLIPLDKPMSLAWSIVPLVKGLRFTRTDQANGKQYCDIIAVFMEALGYGIALRFKVLGYYIIKVYVYHIGDVHFCSRGASRLTPYGVRS